MLKKIILFSLLVFTIQLQAQSLEETLGSLSSSGGKAYLAPAVTAFGSNLNSGWVSKIPASTMLAFHIDLKVVAMGSFFSTDQKNFNAAGTFKFSNSQVDQLLSASGYTAANMGQTNYNNLKNEIMKADIQVNFSGPTIAGKKDENVKVNFAGQKFTVSNQQYDLKSYQWSLDQVKGFLDDYPALPGGAAQLTVGTIAGTNFSFRYCPDIDIKDLGKFNLWGAGFLHNINSWLPTPLPVDISAGYFYQKLKVGSIFESDASQYGIYVGKTFGSAFAVSPYFGLTMESSKSTIDYDFDPEQVVNGVAVPKIHVNMELEGENTGAATIGLGIKLGLINIILDYKVAKTKTASAGISLGW
jgi:hypothetical protein